MNTAKCPIKCAGIQVNIEKLLTTHLCFDLKIVHSLSNLYDLTPIEPYLKGWLQIKRLGL